MATLAAAIPQAYGLVGASCSALAFVLAWQTTLVSGARKKAKIPYPQLYATPEQEKASKEALIYNCTQRAHANTLEIAPVALFSTLFTGLVYPRFAAATMTAYVIGKIMYTIGYTTGKPERRRLGMLATLASFVLLFQSAYVSYEIFITGKL